MHVIIHCLRTDGINSLPWGTNQNLTDDEFYNRKWGLNTINTFLQTTANENAPKILLTCMMVLEKQFF